ncbi:MAG: 3-methyl-2-oxobutanoate hydroxymethyltransferase [candidate division KSB1 bacterium]|nr:3-methyl-2-oxobutanoate hydroxymethyltransferase [candidate division KSB1 bacterium]MDZ7274953.1 3-methyl-2-oxobutanoate hydroxymethyltransferase [candidate division KSB1 bacterium]MDZ7286596.1 3-methyl-2-oxobutanoate hydroxymethyltransferase [candidate division KSB1 bacterium]MDZ7299240.1 3-methyl-2-oxobutanoate hydroxymethyltransferase [candidate division KSB1 bacterium]MDZ7308903.1 3-methyl-2-oxobutanoate hydroxymethyltransferase [candidate division KSB1 bacterium]
MSVQNQPTKITIPDLHAKKARGEKIVMLTAYDYSSAMLVEQAGVEVILVGDSLGMVMLGYDSTVAVTMSEMLHHCRAVARGARRAFKIGDMPFGSYETSPAEAVRNAARFLKEGMMEAVKLEGGLEMAPAVKAIVAAGIPVMGHIGLTPQSLSKLGGYRVQGKTAESAFDLLQDALILQDAGCFALVLEAIPAPLAALITARLEIPVIGIGAGAACDGQVLVYHDLLGLFEGLQPRFVKRYAQAGTFIRAALASYRDEVISGRFPGAEHTYQMPPEEMARLEEMIRNAEAP